MRPSEKSIGRLVDRAASVFFAWEREDEEIHTLSRLKLTLKRRNELKEFWFSAQLSPELVDFLRANSQAYLFFLHKSFLKSVRFSGVIEVQGPEAIFPLKFIATDCMYCANTLLYQ